MIRRFVNADFQAVEEIILDAAEAYRGAIPDDCWHEPYMSAAELRAEIAAGVEFWIWDDKGRVTGAMGLQRVADVTLIRHAYVRKEEQGRGIGGKLLEYLSERASGRLLVGTWAAAIWAIGFYQRHGFQLVSPVEEKDRLLSTYWHISDRQKAVSVVLSR